jgi:hypothetical protein
MLHPFLLVLSGLYFRRHRPCRETVLTVCCPRELALFPVKKPPLLDEEVQRKLGMVMITTLLLEWTRNQNPLTPEPDSPVSGVTFFKRDEKLIRIPTRKIFRL